MDEVTRRLTAIRDRHHDRTMVNTQGPNPFELCDTCDAPWPCLDYVDAQALIDQAAKRDAEIREHAQIAYKGAATQHLDTVANHIEAILEVLGCRGCARDPEVLQPSGQYRHDIPGGRL